MVGELDLHARATASAELAAMQAQIEPHFLFNALNTIAAFCRTQPDEARRLVLAFAEHCRSACAARTRSSPLRDELRHVEAYVALERARFGDQLEVDVRVDARRRARRSVPPLLVQPLVENAIKHGKTDRPLRVVVRCRGALRAAAHHGARQRPRHPARARRPRARAGRRLGRRRARPGLGRAARRGLLRRARAAAHRLGAAHRYARLDRDAHRSARTRAGRLAGT